jgi:LacI family transcriptional regulator, repressor for deo operon, udp, cdd, tsx, nupC, and nupG
MGVTIRDVAALAEVSIATVSRAMRDHASVSHATRRRVLEAAERLGYVPSPRAPSVEPGRRIAIITPFMSRWFFGHVLEGIERVLHDRSLDMLVLRTEPGRRRVIPPDLHVRGVVGVVILCLQPSMEEVEPLLSRGIPVSVLGVNHPTLPHVRIDDIAAAREVTRHLLDLGHERIGLVGGLRYDTQPFLVPQDRRSGFLAELAESGIDWDPALEVNADFTTRGAMRSAQALFDMAHPPTAIVAESDEMAFGVMAAAQRRGLSVPHDLSIVGFDDHELAEAWDLTTVAQPVEAQGEVVAWQVLSGLGQAAVAVGSVEMPTSLIIRGSCRKLDSGNAIEVRE